MGMLIVSRVVRIVVSSQGKRDILGEFRPWLWEKGGVEEVVVS